MTNTQIECLPPKQQQVSTDCVQLIIPDHDNDNNDDCNNDDCNNADDQNHDNCSRQQQQQQQKQQNEQSQPIDTANESSTTQIVQQIDRNRTTTNSTSTSDDIDDIELDKLDTHAKIERFRQLERRAQHLNDLVIPRPYNQTRRVRGLEAIQRQLKSSVKSSSNASSNEHSLNDHQTALIVKTKTDHQEHTDSDSDTMSWRSSPVSPAVSGASCATNDSSISTGDSTNSNVSCQRTNNEMSACQLIPKLIDRLDRKLNVMKHERVALDGDTQANEAAGRRLFEVLKSHLTYNEFDKVRNHANETEKVTRLILTLKSRLENVQRAISTISISQQNQQQQQQQNQQQQQQQQDQQRLTSNDCHNNQQMLRSDLQQVPTGRNSKQQSSTINLSTTRGVSDPTGERQHPVRRSGACPQRRQTAICCTTTDDHNSDDDSTSTTTPNGNNDDRRRRHRHDADCHESSLAPKGIKTNMMASSGSSITSGTGSADGGVSDDNGSTNEVSSLFNSTDSAIGSALTGCSSPTPSLVHRSSDLSSTSHDVDRSCESVIVSANNDINQQTPIITGQRVSIKDLKAHNRHQSRSLSHLSHLGTSTTAPGAETGTTATVTAAATTTTSLSSSSSLIAHQTLNVGTNEQQKESKTTLSVLCELDILSSKRDKLKHQLDEAHQLEEIIERRNDSIVAKILTKYFVYPTSIGNQSWFQDGTNCEQQQQQQQQQQRQHQLAMLNSNDMINSSDEHLPISTNWAIVDEFRQYIRLKSLLIKETRELNERIELAERQLIELKHQQLLVATSSLPD